jgi:GT2 family glycosyltransferase
MDVNKRLITFCILHTSRLSCTKRCISSIERYTDLGYCIKMLRQGYADKETEIYFEEMEKRDDFEVIRLEKNIGISAGRKLLLEKTKTPLVMMLDNDVYVTEGWLNPILEILENREDVGFVGIPRYKFNEELENIGGRKIKILGSVIHIETPEIKEKENEEYIIVDDLSGGVMLLRQEAKSDFVYDPQYFIAYEDLDKGVQLLASKWKKVVCLRSRVIHDQVKDVNYTVLRMNYPEISRSYAKFRKKWGLRLPWRRHFLLKYVYPLILPQLYETLHKLKHSIFGSQP